jgi:uncharacterized protein YbjT (DUF2867 family)
MKIVVIGGTGLIGSKLVAKLRDHGHDAIAAALPRSTRSPAKASRKPCQVPTWWSTCRTHRASRTQQF